MMRCFLCGVVFCFSLLVVFAGSSRAALTDGLVGYWPLDDLEAIDASGNGLDGIVNGQVEAVEDRFGEADGAMLFPGLADSHVDLGDEGQFQISGAMTLAAWVILDSFNTNIEKDGLGRASYEIRLQRWSHSCRSRAVRM